MFAIFRASSSLFLYNLLVQIVWTENPAQVLKHIWNAIIANVLVTRSIFFFWSHSNMVNWLRAINKKISIHGHGLLLASSMEIGFSNQIPWKEEKRTDIVFSKWFHVQPRCKNLHSPLNEQHNKIVRRIIFPSIN